MSPGEDKGMAGGMTRLLGLFKRGAGENTATPSIDALRFDTTGYEFHGELQAGRLRVWWTPEGDGLGVHFFAIPPDLPAGASSVDDFAAYYWGMLGDSGGRLIETEVVVAGGCPTLRTIVSIPQQPTGRSCIGSLTVPFRDFSFVLKCQCLERGTTGIKEAILYDRDPHANPDVSEHDPEFPDHPVARARRVLDHVERSMVVTGEVRQLPGFVLPRA